MPGSRSLTWLRPASWSSTGDRIGSEMSLAMTLLVSAQRGIWSCVPSTARDKPLNYRHAFHAGNFADLIKHAVLLQLLPQLQEAGALAVLDTHAGRGAYDLTGVEAKRSGEAEAGVARLMSEDAPAV